MLDVASKAFFQALSRSRSLKTLASRYGMRGQNAFARRFIAGENIAQAIEAVQRLEAQRLPHTLDHLGQSVSTHAGAESCTTETDFERVNALGARVWLVKGAYKEPKAVAYQLKADVDAAYVRLAKRLLTEGTCPAIATHDEAILREVTRFAREQDISADRY